MNKNEYLFELKRHLQNFPQEEVTDILSDYEEHFSVGLSKGKSEEEISKELGNPRDIAKTFKGAYRTYNNDASLTNTYTQTNDTTRKIVVAILLFFFNLIIVLGPYIAIAGILLSLFITGLGLTIGGFVAFIGFPLVIFTPIASPHILTSISIGIGLIAAGLLVIILAVYLTKLFVQLTLRYAKWNINLINGQEVI